MLLCQRTHKTHSNYHHLIAVELPFVPKVIECMHQTIKTYIEREHKSCSLLPALSTFSKSVTVSVAMLKMGAVLRQAWSESQWTVLMGYLTISTNVRRYQTHITDDIFSFKKTTHWCACIVHATQTNCCGCLDFLSPEPCPPTARAKRIDYKI